MLPVHDQGAIGPLATSLTYALRAAGLPSDNVDTSIQSSPQAIHVRVLRNDGHDVTLEQLVTITGVLRSVERSGRAITALAA